MERQPGYHATGRSAASYSASYGNEVVRKLTIASRDHYWQPPAAFTDVPLIRPRAQLYVASPQQYDALDQLLREEPCIVEIPHASIGGHCPILRTDVPWRAALDRSTAELDVEAILQGYLRAARATGTRVLMDSAVVALERHHDSWDVHTPTRRVRSKLIINAAGAWSDSIAMLAGLAPLGIVPHRRTAILIDPPEGVDIGDWPFVIGTSDGFYFKPEAGRLLISPVDETPTVAADAQPEEIDVATAVDRFESATTMTVPRVSHRWAGLRTFAPDHSPVVGFDPRVEGFFWVAALGGYGIQLAPAISTLVRGLVKNHTVPACLSADGIDAHMLAPDRLLAAAHA